MEPRFRVVNVADWNDIGFLYLLLSQRSSEENISHSKMPSFLEHHAFVQSDPYKVWYMIYIENEPFEECKIGSVYISKENYVGIHLVRAFQKMGIGTEILKQIVLDDVTSRPIYANINPANAKSIKLFERAGFIHIQNTYKLS